MTASRWYRYLRFWRRDVRADIDDELRFHFDARIEELVGQGMTARAARARAIAEFGDVEEVRRDLGEIGDRVARRRDRGEWFDALRQDVLYSVRSLRRTPAVSLTIIVTLALGLGVNAAMFSLLDAVFVRPPTGVARPRELRRLWAERHFSNGTQFWPGFDYASYDALSATLGDRAELFAYRYPVSSAIGEGEDPPTANVVAATANYFRVLGVHPAIGRFYSPEEDRVDAPAPVVVVSDAFWRGRLDGDPRVIGRSIDVSDAGFGSNQLRHYTIIGVMPARFSGVDLDAVDIWRPIGSGMPAGKDPWYRNPRINGFQVGLRLAPDAREGELIQRATNRLRGPGIDFLQDTTVVAQFGPVVRARGPGKLDSSVQVATRLGGVAIIVLIVACANIVNLLLARAVRRRREIAIRLTLGVSRARLVRLLVTESVLLALVAAVAAAFAALWGGTLLRQLLTPEIHWADSPLNARVLAFAGLAALACGIVAGLVPALQTLSPDLTTALKAGAREGSSRPSRLRSSLIVVQAALSVVLMVGAALFVRSLTNVEAFDIGYSVDRLAFVSLANGALDSTGRRAQSDRLLAMQPRFERIPGVERVAYTSGRPKYAIQFTTYFPDADTLAHKKPAGIFTAVTSGFFAASGTRLLRGHDFSPSPTPADPYTVIVNQAMADALWPHEEPMGRCIRFEKTPTCATIVGVVQTAMLNDVKEDPSPHMYLQLDHMPIGGWRVGDVVLRVDPRRTTAVLNEMRAMLRTEFPNVYSRSTTMAAAMEPDYRPWRLGATLFTLFGFLALVVAGVGVYSSVSYGVSQRTHEFGVRAALGATIGDVLGQVLREGLRTVSVGVAVGVVLALLAGRLVASLLYGVKATDPSAMTIAAAMLLLIAAIASLVPAWRAAQANPVEALRSE
jgi:putative ABC transport system permease protein